MKKKTATERLFLCRFDVKNCNRRIIKLKFIQFLNVMLKRKEKTVRFHVFNEFYSAL